MSFLKLSPNDREKEQANFEENIYFSQSAKFGSGGRRGRNRPNFIIFFESDFPEPLICLFFWNKMLIREKLI